MMVLITGVSMALFKKGNKTPKEKPVKKDKKAKGGLFGRSKKNQSLIDMMQLDESVAEPSLEVVADLSDRDDSAVRQVSDAGGYLIVAFTNTMLEAAELDPSSEEFGSFAEALRTETVESIALINDLEEGIVGIIPSIDSLIALDEFEFAHNLEFKWALVPFDLDNDSQLDILNSTVSLAKLTEMANEPSITAMIDEDSKEVILSDGDDYEEDEFGVNEPSESESDDFDDDDFDFDATPEEVPATSDDFEVADEDIVEEVPDDDDFDDDLDDDLDLEDDEPAPAVTESTDNFDDDLDLDDDLDDDYSDDFGDTTPSEPEEDELTPEESNALIEQAATHSFANTELGIDLDMSVFDDLYRPDDVIQFETNFDEDSELQRVISKMHKDHNTELKRLHKGKVQALRAKYASGISDIYTHVADHVDHMNPNTVYGERLEKIKAEYRDKKRNIDAAVASRRNVINDEYRERREAHGEAAKQEAMASFDKTHRSQLDAELTNITADISTEITNEKNYRTAELLKDRRLVSARLFDDIKVKLLKSIQKEYQEFANKELRMYDAFRKDADTYLRKHFSDDVLRSKAQAESLRQNHEADRVRREYGEMLTSKARQIEELENDAAAKHRQLTEEHRNDIAQIKAEHDRELERLQKEAAGLRDMLQDANESVTKISEQKEKEIEHRIKVYEDRIQSKDLELQYANERLTTKNRPMFAIMIAIGAVSIMLGLILGFILGIDRTAPAQGVETSFAPIETEADEIVYDLPTAAIDFETVYDTFVDTPEFSGTGIDLEADFKASA